MFKILASVHIPLSKTSLLMIFSLLCLPCSSAAEENLLLAFIPAFATLYFEAFEVGNTPSDSQ